MILTAVQIEAKAVARALGLCRSGKVSWNSRPNQRLPISMYMIGMGARQLPAVKPDELRFIMMAGLAGGLDPTLQIGDVIIDDQSTLPTQYKALRGKIYTSDVVMATPAEKIDCQERSGAVVVDMENQIVREWAAKMNVPFLGIRAVSDRADDPLDPTVAQAIDEFGCVKPAVIATALLARPSRIGGLIRLGQHARIASKRLGKAVAEIVVGSEEFA